MRFYWTKPFKEDYQKLAKVQRKKLAKQLSFLERNFFHPSLKPKKMTGENLWEARLNRRYRFTFHRGGEDVFQLVLMMKGWERNKFHPSRWRIFNVYRQR